MLEQFREYIESNHLIAKGERVLVALSGGVDSMVLAELLRRCGYDINFAHCNFKLRGTESDGDEQFVREYAERVGVKLFVKKFDTHQYVADNKVSVEMAARELRYAWFNDLITAQFDKLALAHHADDQIETFFINLLRGSGIKGLKAMQPCNGVYIRPLLWASREEIKKFAVENGIQWREDSTNQDTVFLRNKIRHNLMPVFDGIKPDAREKILESIECLAAENQLYRELLKEKLSAIETVDGVLRSIPKCHFELQLLFEWLRPFGFSYSQCESIFTSFDGEPGKEFNSTNYQLVVEKETVELFPIGVERTAKKELSFDEFEKTSNFKVQTSNSDIAQLDFDKLKLPLKVRSWQQGDRFRPLGMRGSKLVSDFFNDLNFTAYRKKTAQILTDADGNIVWIVGYRIDDRYKITEKTKTIYQIEVK
jgi:tRNA(Ile)-lysidine synthase